MEERGWNPFDSEDVEAREDFLRFMSGPYGQPADSDFLPFDLVDELDIDCISEDSDIAAFEYYHKLASFYDWRVNEGFETYAALDIYEPNFPDDCPANVLNKMNFF